MRARLVVELPARHWLLALVLACVTHALVLSLSVRPAVRDRSAGFPGVDISLEPSAWGLEQPMVEEIAEVEAIEPKEAMAALAEEAKVPEAGLADAASVPAPVADAVNAELGLETEAGLAAGVTVATAESIAAARTDTEVREAEALPTLAAPERVARQAEAGLDEVMSAEVTRVAPVEPVPAAMTLVPDTLSAAPAKGPAEKIGVPTVIPTVAGEAQAVQSTVPVAASVVFGDLSESLAAPVAVTAEPVPTVGLSVATMAVAAEPPSGGATDLAPVGVVAEADLSEASELPVRFAVGAAETPRDLGSGAVGEIAAAEPELGAGAATWKPATEVVAVDEPATIAIAAPSVGAVSASAVRPRTVFTSQSITEVTAGAVNPAEAFSAPGRVMEGPVAQHQWARVETVMDVPAVETSPDVAAAKPLQFVEPVEAQSVEQPDKTVLARLERAPVVATYRYAVRGHRLVRAGQLSEAERLLQHARREEPAHPKVTAFGKALGVRRSQAEAAFQEYRRALERGQLHTADRHLTRAKGFWTDNPAYARAQKVLRERMLSPGRPRRPDITRSVCRAGYAGHGRRERATCYDALSATDRGPLLVVVPAGEAMPNPFAIGKHEVSVADYNTYCRLSGRCRAITDRYNQLPATRLTLDQAQAYARWLSDRTGHTYRLPTDEEWLHAALAAGEQPSRDFNCLARLGRQVFKGTGLIDARSGVSNGWGLLNYVGNAQEWVLTSSGTLAARGGAFRDIQWKCDISLIRKHDGRADEITGFRLVRELRPRS